MNSDFLKLQSSANVRFSEILSRSLADLEKLHLEGHLTPEEVQLFQYNDFYFTYAQHNHPELELTSREILPLDQNNVSYSNWREVVLALEKLRENKKQVMERLYTTQLQFGRFGLPEELRVMVLQNLSSDQIISHCQANVSETLCWDENSLLWKELYHRDISSVPLPIETELIEIITENYRQINIIAEGNTKLPFPTVEFYPKSFIGDAKLIPITYKKIYESFSAFKKEEEFYNNSYDNNSYDRMFLDRRQTYFREQRYVFLASLGADKEKLMKMEMKDKRDDGEIFWAVKRIFEHAAYNNHYNLVDKYFDIYNRNANKDTKEKLIYTIIFYKGFYDMAKHIILRAGITNLVKILGKGFSSKYNNLNISAETFKYIITSLLTSEEMEELYKVMSEYKFILTHNLMSESLLEQTHTKEVLDKIDLFLKILKKHYE